MSIRTKRLKSSITNVYYTRISVVPQTYGTTGIRSFFIGTDGVIRGADKNGLPADENDPPINE